MMHKRLFVCVATAAILLTALRCRADGTSNDVTTAQRIADYMNAVNALGPFNGAILVAKDDRIIVSQSYGMAEFEFQVPIRPQTRFRIASITKPFTATAVMLLVDDGKLAVSDPIGKYLSNCPDAWKDVTVDHLLRQTSGLPEFSDLPGFEEQSRAFANGKDFIAQLANAPLQFAPCKEQKYTNSNYMLLGYIVEAVSGVSYEEFLQQRICKPLNLANTGCDHGTTIIDHRALGYTWKKHAVPASFLDMHNTFGSGCMYSTADDLLRFVKGLTGGHLITQASVDAMLRSQESDYGYGWFVARWNDRRLIRHGGGMSGVSADLRWLPDDQIYVVVLSNVDAMKTSPIAEDLLRLALGESVDTTALASPFDLVRNLEESAGDPKIAEACVGTYAIPMGELIVSREGDKLFVKLPGDPEKAELQRDSGMTFFIRGPGELVMTFDKDSHGLVDQVHVTLRGREFIGKRIK